MEMDFNVNVKIQAWESKLRRCKRKRKKMQKRKEKNLQSYKRRQEGQQKSPFSTSLSLYF